MKWKSKSDSRIGSSFVDDSIIILSTDPKEIKDMNDLAYAFIMRMVKEGVITDIEKTYFMEILAIKKENHA